MAVVTFLLSYLARQANNIVQAIFGWSITALFGKLQRRQQVLVTAALLVSLIWPLFVLGTALPGVAAWAIAFVPLHDWLGDTVLRIIWLSLAVAAPLAVGILVHLAAPVRRGSLPRAAVTGYATALGFFAAFVVVAITVPVLKVASIVRRWSDDHVYVQPHDGDYDAVLRELADAVERAGLHARISDVPRHMVLATTIMRGFARGTVSAFVAPTLRRVTAPGLELYLYPADLLIRGEASKVARVRSMFGRTQLDAHAYLVAEPDAQHVQQVLASLAKQSTRGADGRALCPKLRGAYHEILALDVGYDEFVILDAMARRLERHFLRDGLVDGSDLPIDDAQDVAAAKAAA
ncbi:MAG TPA: hypothetical protein VH914_21520 [Acidimicrobiia bacterium]|jgi:hypothetical protein|nr:hypothetical protein [Acidimicrobiia bacterium]